MGDSELKNVRFEIATLPGGATSSDPSIEIEFGPGPTIDRLRRMTISSPFPFRGGRFSEIVPDNPVAKVIVAPDWASEIAWRSEPGPSVLRLVTTSVFGAAGVACCAYAGAKASANSTIRVKVD